MIFNKELADYLKSFRWNGNREQKQIEDEELNRIVIIMARVAESYSCSVAEGFTYEEGALERVLTIFYNAAFEQGKEAAKREIIWQIQKSIYAEQKSKEDL